MIKTQALAFKLPPKRLPYEYKIYLHALGQKSAKTSLVQKYWKSITMRPSYRECTVICRRKVRVEGLAGRHCGGVSPKQSHEDCFGLRPRNDEIVKTFDSNSFLDARIEKLQARIARHPICNFLW
jgi:hypothetical protein